jgi:hypothetical protein
MRKAVKKRRQNVDIRGPSGLKIFACAGCNVDIGTPINTGLKI